MSEPPPYPYLLGTSYPVMPNPMTPEHCIDVPAGAVTLVVEARDLVDERSADPGAFDDFGASLHVLGPDRAEYVRFDCFEKEPHYHYIRPSEHTNIIVRLDEIAEGDPIEWTLARLRNRLPEMLEHAGATDVAGSVRAQLPELTGALDTVGDLLREAQHRATQRRATQRRATGRRASGSTLAVDSATRTD